MGDLGSIPRLGRSPGGGRGNPLQYPCLKNPMDRGNWGATVHRVAKSQTQLQQLSIYTKELFTDIIARLKVHSGDFPGGPVVKNLSCSSQSRCGIAELHGFCLLEAYVQCCA